MQKIFTLSNGKKININYLKGDVIEEKDWSEEKINSTSSPGFVTKGGVIIGGGTTVRSETIARQNIWLRLEDGKEQCFSTQNRQIPTRSGHKIIMITGGVEDKKNGAFLAAYLFNGNETVDFMQGGFGRATLLGSGLASPIWIGLRTMFYCGCVATMIGIPLIPIVMYVTHRKHKTISKELAQHVLGSMPEAISA